MATTTEPEERLHEQTAPASVQSAPTDPPDDAPAWTPKPGAFLTVALCIGLLAGFAEAGVLAYKRFVLGQFIFQGQHYVWMAPALDAIVCLALAVPFVLVAWRHPAGLSLFLPVGLLALVGSLCVLLAVGAFFLWASVLLAVGIGIQSARLAHSRPKGFLSVARAGALALAGVVVLLALGPAGLRALEERKAPDAIPAPGPGAPNVLFIVLDTVRSDSLDLDAPSARTPNLARLATTGTVFTRALSPSSWTLPAHASMFTGRYPHQLSAGWHTPLDRRHTTLAEVLGRAGYVTAGFVANTYYCSPETGLHRGFAHYEAYKASVGQALHSTAFARLVHVSYNGLAAFGVYGDLARKNAAMLNRDFLSWLERKPERPFFAFLNYFDAHDPYLPPEVMPPAPALGHDDKLTMRNWWRFDKRQLAPAQINVARCAYQASIAYLDHQLGRLFQALRERHVLDNTLVIVTSDHGELFGEFNTFYHGNSLYLPVVHVPLLVCCPGRVPAGRRVSAPVTLRDLPATVVDLLDLGPKASLPGRSLRPCWDTDGASHALSRPFALVQPFPCPGRFPDHQQGPAHHGPMHSVVIDDHYYIRRGDGHEELFTFGPTAQPDAAADRADILRRARQALEQVLGPHGS